MRTRSLGCPSIHVSTDQARRSSQTWASVTCASCPTTRRSSLGSRGLACASSSGSPLTWPQTPRTSATSGQRRIAWGTCSSSTTRSPPQTAWTRPHRCRFWGSRRRLPTPPARRTRPMFRWAIRLPSKATTGRRDSKARQGRRRCVMEQRCENLGSAESGVVMIASRRRVPFDGLPYDVIGQLRMLLSQGHFGFVIMIQVFGISTFGDCVRSVWLWSSQ
mmetsp:Transcript_21026/g.45126  ORF Transcript_21026/g.45126 Transcript_21026/m.45126 type:complete len:219 (+) Transcript_21026:533-1189(+)